MFPHTGSLAALSKTAVLSIDGQGVTRGSASHCRVYTTGTFPDQQVNVEGRHVQGRMTELVQPLVLLWP